MVIMNDENNDPRSTIYGPVNSWRFGRSLGIDPIFVRSTCSFNCRYCQLGQIQDVTTERQVFVPTAQVIRDFEAFLANNEPYDVITFSGSGEPTLAHNLGEIARQLKQLAPDKPLQILTNATLLSDAAVRSDLRLFDRVVAKLDALDDRLLAIINQAHSTVTIQQILTGIKALREDSHYQGLLDLQMMFTPANIDQAADYLPLIQPLAPDSVQLNTPLRPYPLRWLRENRGNASRLTTAEKRTLSTIDRDQANALEKLFREQLDCPVSQVYRE